MGGRGVSFIESPDSRCGAPPNREAREGWVVRSMVLAGDMAGPVSRRGARGGESGIRALHEEYPSQKFAPIVYDCRLCMSR